MIRIHKYLVVAILASSMGFNINVAFAQGFSPRQSPPETQSVPGNMLFALSVEYPTGLQISYTGVNYNNAITYEGYFDSRKCYSYNTTDEFFSPESGRTATGACPNTSHWSGNLLNWLTMSNLDQFRSVMTGGTRDNFSSKNASHPGDTTDRTILIRSFSDRNEFNPLKNLSSAWVGVPSTLGAAATDNVRSGGYGSKFFISDSNNFANLTAAQQRETCAATVARGIAHMDLCYNIRVEVCKTVASTTVLGVTTPGVGREDNCKGPYGTSTTYYKPEGLVQEYSSSIRFGAMGYLNQSGQDRNGGVLRARMKSLGSTLIGQGNGVNANKEWGSDGILNVNPDPTDATASGVTQSGLINYLNLFGYAAGYKGNDPVGEMYYAAQLYFRNQSFPADYTNDLTAARLDGFPVITNFSDPIIRSCQKNFILGLGDIFTHCDGNLPGSPSTGGATCPGVSPTDPAGLNVGTLWDSVTAMENSTAWVGGATAGRPYMAGLAWWANVNDIRTDLAGKQTISTYWVDVLENNNGGAGIAARSQFWLAAKYGGFRQELVTNNGTNPNATVGSWDKDGNGIPDTLFAGNSPSVLKQSLKAAFQDIASRAEDSSASSAAVTSNRQTSSSQIIYAGYNPKNWTGGVRSCSPNQTAVQCDASPTWETSRWFDVTYTAGASPKLNSSNRKIFTSNLALSGTFTKMPFLWNSLNTTQQSILNAPNLDNRGSDRVSYLRGDTSLDGTLFRKRGSPLMGDIVNSNITYLIGSGPLYRSSNYTDHETYWTANKARPAVVYVGSNDGMLRAIDGNNGKELWAYVPGSVFSKLPNLTNISFVHQYLVDGTAMTADTETGVTSSPWRTMLVGGLGAGGRGYYALDISRQIADAATGKSFANMTEAELANIPMWEFTDATDSDLGYSFNEPPVDPITGSFLQIKKVASASVATGEWRVIVGNGYGNPNNKATLFMLNTETGAIASKITATTGGGVNGLSTPTPVDTNGDGLIDVIYAGDLFGKLHKFQFSKLAVNALDYVPAASGDVDGAWRYIGVLFNSGEPITTAPVVTKSKLGTGWQVQFGTGKLIEDSDFTDTSSRTFYSVVDNNVSSSLLVSASELAPISVTTTTTNGVSYRNWSAPNLSGKKGWKIVFTGGERIISNPTIPPDTGVVLFGTAKPSGDLCEPGSSGFLMAINLANGGTGDIAIDGLVVGGYGVTASGVLKVSNTYSDRQNRQTIVCNQADCQKTSPPTIKSNSAPRARYSWRQLLSR